MNYSAVKTCFEFLSKSRLKESSKLQKLKVTRNAFVPSRSFVYAPHRIRPLCGTLLVQLYSDSVKSLHGVIVS